MNKLLEEFKKEVCERAKEVDPQEELDWYALSIGFFLAKGATLEEAEKLAVEARYTHQYWC